MATVQKIKSFNDLSKLQKLFIKKYPNYDVPLNEDGTFSDHLVQDFFDMFRSGYQSHPQFNRGNLHIIAKETETGIEVEKNPRVHVSFIIASQERQRLTDNIGGTFHIFSNSQPDTDPLREKVIKKYQQHSRKK